MSVKKSIRITDIEGILDDLLNLQDSEVVVVRGKECRILFANAAARARFEDVPFIGQKCKTVYAKDFPQICLRCAFGQTDEAISGEPFEITGNDGRVYSARCTVINWIDAKPASMLSIRDITKEKEASERMYALAYIDQLTNVPNRQKLKDDFRNLEESISVGQISGVVAMFDLDRFKVVNDTYGHNTGDLILRRLTEHLQEDQDFSGHLYRLGGDEFVLLYSEPSDKFQTENEKIEYYFNLLSSALRSYTLPNIDVGCTLSIGVSLFPKHGYNLSELLRKADIAMYQAKNSGRNQIVLFEDRFDVAQEFMDLYISVQPILLESGQTYGYELVDRGNNNEEDDESIVNLSGFNRTLDAMGFEDIGNDLLYYISYSKQLLDTAVMKTLPRNKYVVQIALKEKETKHDLHRYHALHKNGYKLALTGLHSGKLMPESLKYADYCKFAASDKNLIMQKRIIEKHPKTKFIATEVNTPELFLAAKEAGFTLFQGFFFKQQTVVKKTKDISPLKVNYFRLLQLSSTDDYMNFREISSIISSDVALTYKLLRILNSAAVGLRNVSSIAMAVAYLGEENLKKWIAVLALRGIAEDKPPELVRLSLIRARFGELLAPHTVIKRNPREVFMVGLLSLLHVALEMSKEQFLEELPVAEDVRDSLLTQSGVYSDFLSFYEDYEFANWDEISRFVDEQQLDSQTVNDSYIMAVKWYNALSDT